MTSRALNYLAAIAVASIVGLVALAYAPGDQVAASATLSTTLTGSAFAIAALVSPQRPGGQ